MNSIIARYNHNFLPLLSFLFLSTLCVVYYRIETYSLITSLYQDLNPFSFFEYLTISLYQDTLMLILLNLFFTFCFVILQKLKALKFFLVSGLTFLFGVFLMFSIQFFKVYETSLQKSFLAKETLTGIGNYLTSLQAELPFIFWVQIFLVFFCILLAVIFSQRFANKARNAHPFLKSLPIFIYLFLVAGAIFHASPATAQKKEFALNPAFHFLFDSIAQTPQHQFSDQANLSSPSALPFNSNSLLNPAIQPPINLIPKNKKYNIIFYFFESTAYQYLKLKINGRYVMENWNKLEKNSIHFKNHYANYPLSANALYSILTSAYDSNDKDPALTKYPKIPLKTISELLKENGYRTYLLHTGFLEYARQIQFLGHRKFDQILQYKDLIREPKWGGYNVGWGADERVMTRPSVKLLKQNPGQPFFILYMPCNPHHPYAIPDQSFNITGGNSSKLSQREKNWKNYINSLHYADAALGELIDTLEKEGLMKNTILFLFADHGEAFYQHHMNYNHPFFLYEENVHVPFFIYQKDLIKNTLIVNSITRHIDLFPTVLDLIGIPRQPKHEGLSVLSKMPQQAVYLHTSWKDDYTAILDSDWKYIYKTLTHTQELYHLTTDPEEKINLAQQNPQIARQFKQKIQDYRHYKANFYQKLLHP